MQIDNQEEATVEASTEASSAVPTPEMQKGSRKLERFHSSAHPGRAFTFTKLRRLTNRANRGLKDEDIDNVPKQTKMMKVGKRGKPRLHVLHPTKGWKLA